MNSGKILLGVLAGVAIGATLGILFAPDKGSSTRKKISNKSDEYADELEEKFNKFVEEITDKFQTVKDEATSLAADGKHKAEDFVLDKQ
jgi:gas vesicle protein